MGTGAVGRSLHVSHDFHGLSQRSPARLRAVVAGLLRHRTQATDVELVERPGFRNLVARLNPAYIIPNRHTVTDVADEIAD